jgi:hypothetical protein
VAEIIFAVGVGTLISLGLVIRALESISSELKRIRITQENKR